MVGVKCLRKGIVAPAKSLSIGGSAKKKIWLAANSTTVEYPRRKRMWLLLSFTFSIKEKRKKSDTHCFAPGCKARYPGHRGGKGRKLSVFAAPKDGDRRNVRERNLNLRERWVDAPSRRRSSRRFSSGYVRQRHAAATVSRASEVAHIFCHYTC